MAGIIFSKASGVNDSIFGKSQEPIKAIINQKKELFEQKSMISKIFYMDKSTNFAEKYASETSLGNFEDVGENGAYPTTEMQEGFSKVIESRTWKNQFAVTQEMIEDAKIGKIKQKANAFVTSFGRTKEIFAASLLAGGIDTTVKIGGKTYDATGADKVALFSTAHPSATKKGSNQSNRFTAVFGQYVMDKMQESMQDFKDEDGNLLSVMPDTIIIPNDASLTRAVLAAIGSDLDPESNGNAMNFQCGLWNVLRWGYLPKTIGSKSYFMMADSEYLQNYMCLPFVDRVPLSVRSVIDENTDANVMKGRARFGAGFNDWRGIAICGEGVTGGTAITKP